MDVTAQKLTFNINLSIISGWHLWILTWKWKKKKQKQERKWHSRAVERRARTQATLNRNCQKLEAVKIKKKDEWSNKDSCEKWKIITRRKWNEKKVRVTQFEVRCNNLERRPINTWLGNWHILKAKYITKIFHRLFF